jgi:hypothetical protein
MWGDHSEPEGARFIIAKRLLSLIAKYIGDGTVTE